MTTSSLPRLGTLAVGGLLAVTLPFWVGDFYQLHLAALIGVYWVLIAGLNLVVGYTGQLSIGHVGLLSIGSYAFAIVVGRYGVDPLLTLALAGAWAGSAASCWACRRCAFPASTSPWRRWPSP